MPAPFRDCEQSARPPQLRGLSALCLAHRANVISSLFATLQELRCFGGDSQEVVDKIILVGMNFEGDESCESIRATSADEIAFANCSPPEGDLLYSVTLRRCRR